MQDFQDSSQSNSESIDLSQFDDDFDQAEVEENDFSPLPDGRYQVVVERVELTRAKKTGKPMLKWSLRILGPNNRGRMLWRNNVISSPANIKWLKTDLSICGLNLSRLSELQHQLDKLLNIQLEINKRTKGDNESVYFNKQISIDDEYEHSNNETPMDDLPF